MTTSQQQTTRRITRSRPVLRHPMWAPFNQPAPWNRLAAAINPVWSFTDPMARVVDIVDEAPGVRSLWLKPNRNFNGFCPGQHVLLELEIDGVRHARCFSISNAPRSDGMVRLTIKRKDSGPVSTAAHALAAGAVVRLGKAQGAFAPSSSACGLLLVCAGSGATPMLSLLHGLADAGDTRDVVLLQSSRSPADLIFVDELRALAVRLPGLRILTHASAVEGRMDARTFTGLVPDWAAREVLVCGPDGFMRVVEAIYADAGLGEQVRSESFGRRAAPIDPDASAHAVIAENSEQSFTVTAGQSLLDGAEAAGLAPRFGCRRGICRTCQCLKRSGTVTNLLTGQVSGAGEELIQLCISTPQSAVELAL